MTNQLFGWELCVVQQDTFNSHRDYEHVEFYKKKRICISLVQPSEMEKPQLVFNWLKKRTFEKKFDKLYFFQHYSEPLYGAMQKRTENLVFLQGVNLEIVDSLESNGTKCLIFFDDSC